MKNPNPIYPNTKKNPCRSTMCCEHYSRRNPRTGDNPKSDRRVANTFKTLRANLILNDSDLWPVVCPECGHEIRKEIGWLKHTVRINCDVCGADSEFHNDAFVNVIQNLKQAVDAVARAPRLAQKRHKLFKG